MKSPTIADEARMARVCSIATTVAREALGAGHDALTLGHNAFRDRVVEALRRAGFRVSREAPAPYSDSRGNQRAGRVDLFVSGDAEAADIGIEYETSARRAKSIAKLMKLDARKLILYAGDGEIDSFIEARGVADAITVLRLPTTRCKRRRVRLSGRSQRARA